MSDAIGQRRAIGLALSGGGVRAIGFHAGALLELARMGQMGQIVHASTVSGGSLFTGLVFHFAGYRWPTDAEYVRDVFPRIRTHITTTSLQRDAIFRLLANPANWRHIASRANVVAQSLEGCWGISGSLGNLPSTPVWSINGSCSESGRRFRFKSAEMGDYESGYAHAARFPLSAAMAVSAAFPGGIGPLAIDTSHYTWQKKPTWDAAARMPHRPTFEKLHIYDGGVYDNLGIEPLFDVGKQRLRKPEAGDSTSPTIDYLVVSDAGLAYQRHRLPHPLNPLRLKRVADLAFDQVRALRIRSLMNFLDANPSAGCLVPIGTSMPKGETVGESDDHLSADSVRVAAMIGTSLSRLSVEEFDLLARHGRETTRWAARKLIN